MAESLAILNWSEGGTTVNVDVAIGESGALIMSGQDRGAAPRAAFQSDEYEYFVSVPAEAKDTLLLHLVQALFAGTMSAESVFKEWLKERNIPFTFDVWYSPD